MGPNTFRNLTYAAVLFVVCALGYLIYKSSQEKNARQAAASTLLNNDNGLSEYGDTLGSLSGSSIAALPSDSVTNAVDGNFVSGSTPSSYSKKSAKPVEGSSLSDVKEVIAEEPVAKTTKLSGGIDNDDDISSSEKKKVTAKSAPSVTSKGTATKKFDAGKVGNGDFLVMAGSFASTDNANGLVDKLKKMGFINAEAVKMENSANTHVIAGYYDFKGGADAAVRSLKAKNVSAYVKKKSGEIYKASTPTVAPKSPTTKKEAPKSSGTTFKPI